MAPTVMKAICVVKTKQPKVAPPRLRDLPQFGDRKTTYFMGTELAGRRKSSQQYTSVATIKQQQANQFSNHLPTLDSLSSQV